MLSVLASIWLATAPTGSHTLPIVDSNEHTMATALLYSSNTAITAAHAVGSEHTIVFLRCGEELITATVWKRSTVHDLALLWLTTKCDAVQPSRLNDDDPKPGEVLEIYGYPRREFKHTTVKVLTYRLFWNEEHGIFWVGMAVSPTLVPGNSGGPVYNASGKLVGVVHGYVDKDGETYGVVVPVSALLLFLNARS